MQLTCRRLEAPRAEPVEDRERVTARSMRLVSAQIDRMTRLVEDLLDVSRLQTGRLSLQLGEFDLCERIRAAVQAHDWAALEAGLAVTISIGVAMRQASDTAQALVECADGALYEAKDSGRNRVVARFRG